MPVGAGMGGSVSRGGYQDSDSGSPGAGSWEELLTVLGAQAGPAAVPGWGPHLLVVGGGCSNLPWTTPGQAGAVGLLVGMLVFPT